MDALGDAGAATGEMDQGALAAKPMGVSYAQNFEDLMLMRALGHIERGVYIDLGAQDPVRDSVSLAFYERGWRGVHVEPTPEYAAQLERARPDERVVRAAVRASHDPMLFYAIEGSGLSTGDEAIAARHLKAGFPVSPILVECLPLSEVLELVPAGVVHWLKIDVEGMERAALESWGASPVRPWIVVVESTKPLSREPTHHDWEPLLLERGYACVHFDGLNRFYLHADHADLKGAFALPPNLFDGVFITDTAPFAGVLGTQLREAREQLRQSQTFVEAERQVRLGLETVVLDLEGRVRERDQAVQGLGDELAGAGRRIAEGEAAVAAYRQSHSWRLTAPLRRLSLAVAALARRPRPLPAHAPTLPCPSD